MYTYNLTTNAQLLVLATAGAGMLGMTLEEALKRRFFPTPYEMQQEEKISIASNDEQGKGENAEGEKQG